MTEADAPAGPQDTSPGILAAALALLIASMALGGASRGAPLNQAAVELAALPLLWLAMRRLMVLQLWRGALVPLVLLALVLLAPVLQLIPLPPALWMALPGRADEARALADAGLPLSWRPISLAPGETVGCALALLPVAAMALAGLTLRPGEVRTMAGVWVGMGLAGLALGAVQLTTPAYLYAETTAGTVTGFFANRNHEASLLLALIPLAAVGASGLSAGRPRPLAVVNALFLPLAIVGLAAIRSRAGVVLAGPALVGALIVAWRAAGGGRLWTGVLAAGCLTALAAVLAFGLSPILQRFVIASGRAEFRFEAWPHVIAAAKAYQPFGAGAGAFDRIFRQIEPLTLVDGDAFIHAHNEVLEVWLEAGWCGLALVGAFALWLLTAIGRAWLAADPKSRALRAAASVTVLLLLAHAMVDYGLRNLALAVLLAFCCGLLAAPAPARSR
jgi:O-antigen ligase